MAGASVFFAVPGRREQAIRLLKSGSSRLDVVRSLKCAYATFLSELRRNPEFRANVLQAETAGKQRMVRTIMRAATRKRNPDWKAAAWFLERKYWREYSRHNPDVITADQLSASIGRVVAAILASVPKAYHEAVQTKINEIVRGLKHERESRNAGE